MKTVSGVRRILMGVVLAVAALVFLFPFYYMVVGAFQVNPTSSPAGLFPTSGWTLSNFSAIDARIDLGRTLLSSTIFTGGVLLGTLIFGVLAGYALARLEFRGRGLVYTLMLVLQMVPFQLLMIPLYVQVTRIYGLGDSYLGIMLPYLINTTAVFVFRQFFIGLPNSLFEAAKLDGAGELRILWSVALPLVRPALVTATLLTFIGPWNEFLWPFLVTKAADMQPLAVALANYISNVASSEANPNGAILAGACVLAAPVILLFVAFQKQFTSTDLGSATKE